MKDRTAQCPVCGKHIFRYAQICPYCKSETKFVSIDDEQSQSRVKEKMKDTDNAVPKATEEKALAATGTGKAQALSAKESATNDTKKKGHGRMEKYVDHLKKDAEKVHDKYDEKIGQRFSKSTILISTVIILLSITVLGLYIAVQMMNHETFGKDTSVDRAMKLTIDSLENKVLQDSKILAKFPDRKRHCLYYLRNNELHYFDGSTRIDSVFSLPQINPLATVDSEGGILDAYLSTNEQYLVMIVSRKPGNTECGLYRLEIPSHQLDVIDQGQVVREKDGFKVTSGRRTAIYDSTGDKISGMTGKEMDAFEAAQAEAAAKAEKEKADKEKASEKKEEKKADKEPEHEKVTERISHDAVITPKPTEPVVPEKIEIKVK